MSEETGTSNPRPKLIEKLGERRERHVERSRIYRILFALTGAIVTAGGLAMLVLPGPALVVIPIGLAMLAMEFAWAENMLEKTLVQAEKAQATAKEASRIQKILAATATVLGIAAVIAWAIVGDIPVVPDP